MKLAVGCGRAEAPAAAGVISVLAGHVVFAVLYSALFANIAWLMPLLVRLRFGAEDPYWKNWQTTLVTASVPVLLICSIFWGELLRQISLRRYLLIFWAISAVPLGCIAFVHNYWQFLACHLVTSFGTAGWAPVNGYLLKHFYPDSLRGRAFGVVNFAGLAGTVAAAYGVGRWMEIQPEAFRIYFPVAAAAQLTGIGILLGLIRRTATLHTPRPGSVLTWRTLLRPVLETGAVLRRDPAFKRYEVAFMTYGAAFMLCDALLPVLATDRLGLRYEEYAHSTQMTMRLVMLALMLPAGWLNDHLGSIRLSALAFLTLAAYPALLFCAHDRSDLALASAVLGIGMSGVAMSWTLGPVSLARSPEQVPQYLAIHASLVGVRGIIFQTLGMFVYQITHRFEIPLAAAAVAFAAGAAQMWRLHLLGTQTAPARPVRTAEAPVLLPPEPE